MSILTATPVLATGVRADGLLRGAAEQFAGALTTRATRIAQLRERHTVTNEIAPLILIAVIAVAAALALTVIIGAAAAWVYYCQAYFGPRYWPATLARRSPCWAPPSRSAYTYPARLVYDTCMAKVRTNIEIEDTYVAAIMDRFGVHTKTDAVDLALRHLAGQPMTREEALAMRGAEAIGEVPADRAPSS